ncbi:hypothetical protein OIU74_011630 [Salix koriyanagi]|uniref:Uncharacterized protein n=1 Tax=Salix koriyanagi TaxID=2511006 RepID=A0A9Q0YUQ6_9ROSI|nr:hypothetical protein OIU74_011630 [Salix koriyanagi]
MCRYEASYPNPFNKGLSFASESYNFYHSSVSNFNVTIFHIIIVLCSNIGFGFKIFPLPYQDQLGGEMGEADPDLDSLVSSCGQLLYLGPSGASH